MTITNVRIGGGTPSAHTDSVHSGAAANLLTALTPTFSGWDINPGTNAQLVDELLDTAVLLDTAGTNATGVCTITYDLGDSRRRIAFLNVSTNSGGPLLQASDDNTNWYDLSNEGTTVVYTHIGVGKFRYVRFKHPGGVTFISIRMRCYNIN
jgi:hypothetical protein